MSIDNYTDEQLEAELANRKKVIKKPVVKNKPHMVDNLYPHSLKEACKQYIEFLYSDDYHSDESDDYVNDIFEQALEMVYGHDIWDYVNEIVV